MKFETTEEEKMEQCGAFTTPNANFKCKKTKYKEFFPCGKLASAAKREKLT